MGRYVLKRLFQTVIVFIGVTFIIFGAVFLIPGNPVAALAVASHSPPRWYTTSN